MFGRLALHADWISVCPLRFTYCLLGASVFCCISVVLVGMLRTTHTHVRRFTVEFFHWPICTGMVGMKWWSKHPNSYTYTAHVHAYVTQLPYTYGTSSERSVCTFMEFVWVCHGNGFCRTISDDRYYLLLVFFLSFAFILHTNRRERERDVWFWYSFRSTNCAVQFISVNWMLNKLHGRLCVCVCVLRYFGR